MDYVLFSDAASNTSSYLASGELEMTRFCSLSRLLSWYLAGSARPRDARGDIWNEEGHFSFPSIAETEQQSCFENV